jgi:type IV secretion system protein TrbL
MKARSSAVILVVVILLVFVGSANAADMHGVVDTLLGKYQNAGQAWVGTLKNAATTVFWILATISLSWTCISMGIKHADLGELCAELCRFIMFTGLFFWLLSNGPDFANKIISSLRQVGGDASGTGKSIFPGDLITLGMKVMQNTLQHINFLQPESIVVPAIIALIILIVCTLIAVNMILLLCAAWVVLYAGIIFLGFGGCRWTSDMAINYYRTVLGVGVSLMTMQLIIGMGIKFLQDVVASTGQALDPGSLGLIMVACIILAVIAHRLPQMVAGMVVGGGHNGAVGGVGIMTAIGGGMALTSIARGMGAAGAVGAGAAAVSEGAAASHKLLLDRIAAAEAAIAAGSGGGSGENASVVNNPGGDANQSSAQGGLKKNGDKSGPVRSGNSPETGRTPQTPRTNVAASQSGNKSASVNIAPTGETAKEEPLTRPMSPDAQRGYEDPDDII